ncbi:MAG: poly(R)-hydroxyalkanoic acid synthase subunit PhaE [Methylotenera sp.]|nr:poly(R)-hydroxyalkanoic acid synthase subunit PhaE [Methylotenera sp.]
MEIPNDYFDSWIKTQQQAFSSLRDQALQMQSFFPNSGATLDNPFTNWAKSAFQAFPMGADANLTKDTFSKTLYGNEAMQKLYELWQPMLNAIKNKTIDPNNYTDLTDPAKIKQLFDKLFSFDLDAMNQLQKQTAQYADTYQQFGKPWVDAAKSRSSNFTHNDFQPEALVLQMQAAYAMFENTTGKIFSTPAVGKDREKMELMTKCAKAMSNFAANNIEYQKMMHMTGQDAMQAVVKTLAEKLEAGEKFEKFDEFFALWIDTNEKTFNKLFQTKAFSQKRNAMTEAGFEARKLYNEIVENELAGFPIARRSEMDEVYKLVYDLRKQLKSMESQIQELKISASKTKE